VDEGKLLLFLKEEVVHRAPKKGRRVAQEKKRKASEAVDAAEVRKKRGKAGDSISVLSEMAMAAAALKNEDPDPRPFEGDDDEHQSELVLMYNTVRGYVSAINELWSIQTALKQHSAPPPHRVAVKALESSIVRGEHQRRRREYEDRGLATIRDGYTASQIPDLCRCAWENACGPRSEEQHLRTCLDFMFGN
jgi:hypothetical protein